ncbi:MAG: hypothetical protein QXZ22_08700 [Sulfolobales archaeon]
MIEELILLQDHYAKDRCADCVMKHLYTIRAYSLEAQHLDNSAEIKELLKKAIDLSDKHIELVLKSLHGSQVDIEKMVQEVRELRKELVTKLYSTHELEHQHVH